MSLKGWPRKVRWNEFRALEKPPDGEEGDAYLESRFGTPPGKKYPFKKSKSGWRMDGVEFVISIEGSKSWAVKSKRNKDLLNHEQGHFDITGLVGREAYKAIKTLRARTQDALREGLGKFNRQMQKKVDRLHERYDKETDHSNNSKKQDTWDKLIKSAITGGTNLRIP